MVTPTVIPAFAVSPMYKIFASEAPLARYVAVTSALPSVTELSATAVVAYPTTV